MPRALSQLRDTVLVACLAALSCLPPAGWQLCVGADGHWAIEPVAVTADACCDGVADTARPGAAAADDCSDCTDYALTGGATLGARGSDDGPEAAVDAPCMMPGASFAVAGASASRRPAPRARPAPAPSTLRSAILRC